MRHPETIYLSNKKLKNVYEQNLYFDQIYHIEIRKNHSRRRRGAHSITTTSANLKLWLSACDTDLAPVVLNFARKMHYCILQCNEMYRRSRTIRRKSQVYYTYTTDIHQTSTYCIYTKLKYTHTRMSRVISINGLSHKLKLVRVKFSVTAVFCLLFLIFSFFFFPIILARCHRIVRSLASTYYW